MLITVHRCPPRNVHCRSTTPSEDGDESSRIPNSDLKEIISRSEIHFTRAKAKKILIGAGAKEYTSNSVRGLCMLKEAP